MKNKKAILAVSNSAGKGKTSTLRELVVAFQNSYPNHIQLFPVLDAIRETGDFCWVIQIGDLTVAIESCGDPKTDLKGRLAKLKEQWNADVIFCATRTKGETVQVVAHFSASQGFDAIWTSTYVVPADKRAIANATKARHIHDLMQMLGYLP